jgi:Cuticle protein CPCFC
MKVFVALFALVAVAAAMPAPQELPAGLTAAECPNFPYCGLTPEELVPFL